MITCRWCKLYHNTSEQAQECALQASILTLVDDEALVTVKELWEIEDAIDPDVFVMQAALYAAEAIRGKRRFA